MLETMEFTTGDTAQACILWLHGLGADGSDFVPVAQALELPCAVRHVFPHAPVMPITLNGGYRMRAWYDVYSLDIAGQQDVSGIRRAQAMVEALIDEQLRRGCPAARRMAIAGFSQGGAIALQTALRYRDRLAGVLALSTYLPLAHTVAQERSAANLGMPVFMAHGTEDGVIPLHAAVSARDTLSALGYTVEWHEYVMAHTVCSEEIDDMARFLARILAP